MTQPADEPAPEASTSGDTPSDDATSDGDGPGTSLPEGEYFARIEEHFGRRRGGPLVLSPKDWQLVEKWHAEGIPVAVVLRGINRAFDRFRHSGPRTDRINSLRYCAQHVDEAWQEHREARASRRRPDDSAATDEAVAHLSAAAGACRQAARAADDPDAGAALSRVADELDGLADRVREGEVGPRLVDQAARALEETLEARLAAAAHPAVGGATPGGDRVDSRRAALALPPFSPYGI